MQNDDVSKLVRYAKDYQRSKKTYKYLREEMHGKCRGLMLAARLIKGYSTKAEFVNMNKKAGLK